MTTTSGLACQSDAAAPAAPAAAGAAVCVAPPLPPTSLLVLLVCFASRPLLSLRILRGVTITHSCSASSSAAPRIRPSTSMNVAGADQASEDNTSR